MYREFVAGPPALGQVVVMAFQESRDFIVSKKISLDMLETVLIIKPHANWDVPFYKFPGGMLREGETLPQAALRELHEETGVFPSESPQDLVEFCRVTKGQHPPHSGVFDLALFAAFNCDFRSRYRSDLKESGDEGEENILARFGDLTKLGKKWPVEALPEVSANFFGFHIELLNIAGQTQAA